MTDRDAAVWLQQETTFGQTADATGAAALALKSTGRPWPMDMSSGEDLDIDSGRDDPAEHVITRDGAELDVNVPLFGFATTSGDGDAAPAEDALDWLLESGLGAPVQAHGGEGVGGTSTTANVVLDSSLAGLAVDDIGFVYRGAADTPARVEARRISSISGAPTYGVTPAWAVAPVTAAVFLGSRGYGQNAQLAAAGASIEALVLRNQVLYRLLGGRAKSLALKAQSGQVPRLTGKVGFDSWARGATAASRPAITTFPASMVFRLAPVWFNGTRYPIKSIEIDFGLTVVDQDASEATNGRADMVLTRADPVITITPAHAPSVWNDAFRAETVGEFLCQFGGAYLGSRANVAAFHALRAQVIEAPVNQSDSGYLRHQVKLRVLGAGADSRRRWTFARA